MTERRNDRITISPIFWQMYSGLLNEGTVVVDTQGTSEIEQAKKVYKTGLPKFRHSSLHRLALYTFGASDTDRVRALLVDSSRFTVKFLDSSKTDLEEVGGMLSEGYEDITEQVFDGRRSTMLVFEKNKSDN